MFKVAFDLELKGRQGLALADPQPPNDSTSNLFQALAIWWAEKVAQPYVKLTAGQKMRPITAPWAFLGGTITLGVAFDLNLLAQSLEILREMRLERIGEDD